MKYHVTLLFALASGLSALAGVTMIPLASFGGGDGWRAPGEVLATDAAGSATAGVYNYLGTGSNERGIAYNGSADRLILLSRNGGINIRQLDPLSGVDLAAVPTGTGVITGGTFLASMIACGNDGMLYAANLTTGATTTPFKVYKWDNLSNPPAVFFNSTVTGFSASARLGDSFDMMDGPSGPVMVAGCGTGVLGYAAVTGPATVTAVASFNPAGPAAGEFRLGVTFAGNVGEVWGRQTSGSGRRTTYTEGTSTGTYLGDIGGVTGSQAAMDYATINGKQMLAVLNMSNSNVSVYDVSIPAAPALGASTTATSGTLAGNSNGVGSIKWGAISGESAKLYAMTTNQGIQAFTVTVTSDVVAPAISTNPGNRTVYDRGQTTFSVEASGTPPFTYQWYFGTDPVNGANGPNYVINPVSPANAGSYYCRVTNGGGFAETTPAVLTIAPSVNSAALTPVWALSPGSRPWLSSGGDTERGVDYYPAGNRLYIVSRNPSPQIYVLDATTRADLGQLNLTGVAGGNFVLMFPGVADDGVIYACNLSNTGDGSAFRIYKWANDNPATVPVVAYNLNNDLNPVGSRIGDSFDVSGSGAGIRCVAGARNTNQFVIFTESAPDTLTAAPITVAGAPNGAFALGVSFGAGNTVWGHGDGGSLYYCSYDTASGTGSIIASYGAAAGVPAVNTNPVGVDPVNRTLAMLDTGNSDNVRFYSYSADAVPVLTLLDQEFFPTDNANNNRVGSVHVSAGRVFALDTNNGVMSFTTLQPALPVLGAITRNPGANTFSFQLSGTPGFNYVVEGSNDLTLPSWTALATVPFDAATETVTLPLDAQRQFIRARLGP